MKQARGILLTRLLGSSTNPHLLLEPTTTINDFDLRVISIPGVKEAYTFPEAYDANIVRCSFALSRFIAFYFGFDVHKVEQEVNGIRLDATVQAEDTEEDSEVGMIGIEIKLDMHREDHFEEPTDAMFNQMNNQFNKLASIPRFTSHDGYYLLQIHEPTMEGIIKKVRLYEKRFSTPEEDAELIYEAENTCWLCETMERRPEFPSNPYAEYQGLKEHHRWKHMNKYDCPLCHKPQSSKRNLGAHLRTCRGEGSSAAPANKEPREKTIECDECEKMFTTEGRQRSHKARIHDSTRYHECPYCKKGHYPE